MIQTHSKQFKDNTYEINKSVIVQLKTNAPRQQNLFRLYNYQNRFTPISYQTQTDRKSHDISHPIFDCVRRCQSVSKMVYPIYKSFQKGEYDAGELDIFQASYIANVLRVNLHFTCDFNYEFYNIYNDSSLINISFFKTAEYDREKRIQTMMNEFENNIRPELKKLGYGLMMGYGNDIKIELFKLRKFTDED